MDINQIQLTISVTTLALISGSIWKASGWVKSVTMKLSILRKLYVKLESKQEKMIYDIGTRHDTNVAEINNIRLMIEKQIGRVDSMEDKFNLLADGQDDILTAISKRPELSSK